MTIGIIGACDGPTVIYVASKYAPHLLGPVSVAAYSYMSLVPLLQPPDHAGPDHGKRTADHHEDP